MIPLFYASNCSEQFNTRIMRMIEEVVCRYRGSLPNGWRVIIKLQSDGDDQPFYHLDLMSNARGGDFADVKMGMLERFPELSATGTDSPTDMINRIESLVECQIIPEKTAMYASGILAAEASKLTDLPEDDWWMLSRYGLTHWYGGLRIPYDSLVTEGDSIHNKKGEIRIAFSGAKEWQDVFFALRIFYGIQVIMNELWSSDQIWYNLRNLQEDPVVGFWINNMEVSEAPLTW